MRFVLFQGRVEHQSFSIPGSDRLAAKVREGCECNYRNLQLSVSPVRIVWLQTLLIARTDGYKSTFSIPGSDRLAATWVIKVGVMFKPSFQYPRFGSFGCNRLKNHVDGRELTVLSVSPVRIVWLQPF